MVTSNTRLEDFKQRGPRVWAEEAESIEQLQHMIAHECDSIVEADACRAEIARRLGPLAHTVTCPMFMIQTRHADTPPGYIMCSLATTEAMAWQLFIGTVPRTWWQWLAGHDHILEEKAKWSRSGYRAVRVDVSVQLPS